MQTATINVKYVNQPKSGAFSGSIKDASGTYWSVKPEMLANFQPGQTVTVEYEDTVSNGRTYHNIKGLVGHAAPQPAPVPQQMPPTPVPGSQYHPPAQRVERWPHGHGTDAATAERIYCCGIINATVSRQGVTSVAELVQITQWAREAWRQTFGAQ